MEESEEKMAALKRAYADVILNMAKESAARIMASEKRALRFEQDLYRAKEEAVTTLVRVKGILDSKVKEAERVVFVQGRRIRDLETRLAEAESTVAHLRTELLRAEAGGNESDKAEEPFRNEGKEEVQKACTFGWSEGSGQAATLVRCQNTRKVDGEPGDEDLLQGAGGEIPLKYTFRRKRKRGSPTPSLDRRDDCVSPETRNNAAASSSRDSRRIVQVARQLISLSEKKW